MAKGTRGASKGGWAQASALIPVALFASAFTVQATDGSALASSSLEQDSGAVPESIVVPPNTIDDPANLPIPGIVGNGVARDATSGQVVSGLSRNGIPQSALQAYSRAQQVLAKADPSCNLPWTLVAAIGRVESNHGRHGGNVLTEDGIARPGIFGPRLDGASTARITDTDGGELDGDSTFDRAVGPMQFIPGTWRTVGVDGDGDGVRNPQDIDDAAMSAGVYLCSGATDLSDASDLNSAVLRYNHSQSYADLVLSIAKAYADGSWIAVADGQGESDDQGIDRAPDDETDGRIDLPGDGETDYARTRPTDRTRWDKPTPSWIPTERVGKPNKPSSEPTAEPTEPAEPTDEPTDEPTAQPTRQPTTQPTIPTTKPSPPAVAPVLQTAFGTVVGTVGTTVTELSQAASYCQSKLTGPGIPKASQQQFQQCVTAFVEGGKQAADQTIRNLLKLLGVLGILGPGGLSG